MRIFISYAREDYEYAKRLYDSFVLEDELTPWLDEKNLLPGMDWEEEILQAIEESQFILVVLSSNSVNKTGFIQKELKQALERFTHYPPGEILIIPVRIEPCEPKYRELKRLQYVDMFPDWGAGFIRIVKVIKHQVATELDKLFDGLVKHQYMDQAERERWMEVNEGYIKSLRPITVIEFLGKKFDHFDDQHYVLNVMIEIAYRNRLDSLVEYVFAVHELAKKTYYDHEMTEFYGTVLWGSKLLPKYMRSILLRDAFENCVRNSSSYLSGAWWADIILRDIAKHHLVNKGKQYSPAQTIRGRVLTDIDEHMINRDILVRALNVIRWDIPYLDLVVFFARLTRDYYLLVKALPILMRGFQNSDFHSRKNFDINTPFVNFEIHARNSWEEIEVRQADHDKSLYADEKEDVSRIGVLLRIGEYLTYDDREVVRVYGEQLRNRAIEALDLHVPEISKKIRKLSKEESMNFFLKLELMNENALATYFPAQEVRKRVRELMRIGCARYDKDTKEYLPIHIEERDFENACQVD